MRKQRINPHQMVLGMMPKSCEECKSVQHVFFKTNEEYNEWDCPVCEGRIPPDEQEVISTNRDYASDGQPETES